MQVHVKNVQAELMKDYEETYDDHSVTDITNNLHKDHVKRGVMLEKEFTDLRHKLRARFGDADTYYKSKHLKDLKLQIAEAEEPEPELTEEEMVAELEDLRLASQMFNDQ